MVRIFAPEILIRVPTWPKAACDHWPPMAEVVEVPPLGSPSPVFAILFHRLGRRRTAAPFATKTDHPLKVAKLNA